MAAHLTHHEHIALAKTLPSRLQKFFAKYPTATIRGSPSAALSSEGTEDVSGDRLTPITEPAVDATRSATVHPSVIKQFNPFLPVKNSATGRWRGARYGLRVQADLVKIASKHGVGDLLPHTVKKPELRAKRREERGLRVKGTGEGQRVKGKKWERTLRPRLEVRRQAMIEMPRLIQDWKEAGHGRFWKKWPK